MVVAVTAVLDRGSVFDMLEAFVSGLLGLLMVAVEAASKSVAVAGEDVSAWPAAWAALSLLLAAAVVAEFEAIVR